MQLRRLVPVASFLSVALLIAMAPDARAVPYDGNPKILLHVRSVTTKNICTAGAPSDCRDAVTEGALISGNGPYYFVYLLGARGNLPDIAGLQMGIHYENGCPGDRNNGDRLDIFGWMLCATLEFAMPGWPAPNSGNLITWDAVHQCQSGETAIAGYFYVGCYASADILRLIPRPVDGVAKFANCNSVETILPAASLGSASFSSGGAIPGCNPCDGPCTSVGNLPNCTPLPDTTPPNPITDLAVIATSGTSVTLRWTMTGDNGNTGQASSLETRYSTAPINEGNFNFATGVFPPSTPGAPGAVQSRVVNGLPSNTTLYFAMKVLDEVPNFSSLSNVASGTTGAPPPVDLIPPAAVTDLRAVVGTSASLTVQWTVPGDDGTGGGPAASYDIRYSTGPINSDNFGSATPAVPSPPPPATPGQFQSHVLTGLLASTTYYVAMLTSDEVPNVSALSNVASRTTNPPASDSTPPAAVTNLAVVSATYSGVTLSWAAPGDDGSGGGPATSYDVRYSNSIITSANFNAAIGAVGEPVPGQPGTLQLFTVPGLATNVTWYFALRTADDIPNVSGLSNVVNAVIPNATPEANLRTSLVLHVMAPAPQACTRADLPDCRDAVTSGGLMPTGHFVYLLAGQHAEIAGIECGITYDDGQPAGLDDHDRLDVFSWTLCADLEFATTSPAWPAPGSGNLLTWTLAHCQPPTTAVGGYFYVGAYSPDTMRLTIRPASGAAKVANCASAETVLPSEALGTAVFSAGAAVEGYNPCDRGVPTTAIPTTWSRIKVLSGGFTQPETRHTE